MSREKQEIDLTNEKSVSGKKACRNDAGNRPISRRNLIGAAAAGIGAIAAVTTLGQCGASGHTASQDLPESAQSYSRGGAICKQVMPASFMAQSLIAAMAPESLVSLVDDFAVGETPQDIDTGALPHTGPFSEEGIDAFGRMASACSPDLILDVGWYGGSRSSALSMLQEATGISYILINLSEVGFSEAFALASQTLNIDTLEDKVELIKRIEAIEEKAASIEENGRFVVYLGGGEDGFGTYGSGTVEQYAVKNSGSIPYDAEGFSGESGYADSSAFSGDQTPDLVFLSDRDAGEDFVANGSATGSWSVFPVGRLGYVFPALVGGRVWFGEISTFAKATLGAAWIAATLYPNVVEDNASKLTEDFYATLFGRVPSLEATADECKSLIDARLPMEKSELDAEFAAFCEKQSGEAGNLQKSLQEANDPSNLTDEELRAFYEAMCEGWNVEPTEESWQRFLEEIRRG